MTRAQSFFATVDPFGPVPLWSLWHQNKNDFSVIDTEENLSTLLDNHFLLEDEIPLFEFEIPTTINTSNIINKTKKPVLDCEGRPLWNEAQILFHKPATRTSNESVIGRFKTIDRLSNIIISTGSDNQTSTSNNELEINTTQFYTSKNSVILKSPDIKSRISDCDYYIKLISDPRHVCCKYTPNHRFKNSY